MTPGFTQYRERPPCWKPFSSRNWFNNWFCDGAVGTDRGISGKTKAEPAGEIRQSDAALQFEPTTLSLLSSAYIRHARHNCFWLLRHKAPCALRLADASAGNSIAAKMAMMAMT